MVTPVGVKPRLAITDRRTNTIPPLSLSLAGRFICKYTYFLACWPVMAVRNCSISIKWPRNFANTEYIDAARQYQREEGRACASIQVSAHAHANISLQFYIGARPSYGIYISRYLSRAWRACAPRIHRRVQHRRDNFRVEKLTFAARQPRKRGIFHSGRSLASFLVS